MALREDLLKRIEKKRSEIANLETQIRDARVYAQALEDTLKMLPRDTSDGETIPAGGGVLRAGSKVDKARAAIQHAGRPLHVVELLKVLERPNQLSERAALAGSLSAYARKGEIFTRPAPNTFGLLEFAANPPALTQNGPPPNFGVDQPSEPSDGSPDELDFIFEEPNPA